MGKGKLDFKTMLPDEDKNARMGEERAFLTKLLESSINGDFPALKNHVEGKLKEKAGVSKKEILTEYKDGNKRICLHFIAQCASSTMLEDFASWIDNNEVFLEMARIKDKDGITPLMLAAHFDDKALATKRVQFLLGLDAKLALARSAAGATALHYAAGAGGSIQTIMALYNAGKTALSTNSEKGGTPLHWAASLNGDYTNTTLKALVEQCEANLETQNSQGVTPLLLALVAGNDKHGRYLVEQGASFMDKTLPGKVTPVHICADLNLVKTLTAMIEKLTPEEVNKAFESTTDGGDTPLDVACGQKHLECVIILSSENDESKAQQLIDNYKPKEKKTTTASVPFSGKESGEKENQNEVERLAHEIATKASMTTVSADDKKRALASKAEGNQSFLKKDYKQAVGSYSQAIAADPTDAAFYSNRSACYMNLNDPEKALQDAVICRLLRPEWSKGCFRMATARLALGRFEDAAVSAWEGLQLDEENDELKSLFNKCIKQGKKEHQERQNKKS